jgi:hypothetical protein
LEWRLFGFGISVFPQFITGLFRRSIVPIGLELGQSAPDRINGLAQPFPQY